MTTQTISMIIPMYNESRYIARCLDSLKKQTYKDFELILIDDESKDNTVEIAEWYKNDFDLTILKQKNSGPGKARNRWAKEAKGDILIFVDADMKFHKDYVQEITKPIREWKETSTNHGLEYVANLENKVARAYWYMRMDYRKLWPRSYGWFRAVTKELFLGKWGYDISKWYCDDIVQGIDSIIVPTAIVYHNNPESFHEVFRHSMRVWSSLRKTGKMFVYFRIYILWIILFIIISTAFIIYLSKVWMISYVPIWIFIILIVLILAKTIQRTIKEKYISDILYIPLVMITRGVWYIIWACKYMISRKIY